MPWSPLRPLLPSPPQVLPPEVATRTGGSGWPILCRFPFHAVTFYYRQPVIIRPLPPLHQPPVQPQLCVNAALGNERRAVSTRGVGRPGAGREELAGQERVEAPQVVSKPEAAPMGGGGWATGSK